MKKLLLTTIVLALIHFSHAQMFGIMPNATANAYGVHVTRANLDLNNLSKSAVKRLNGFDTLFINTIGTISVKNFSNATSQINAFKWIIGNEEDVNPTDFAPYEAQLSIAAALNPEKVTNGGLTQLRLWYAYQTRDTDFFNNNLTPFQKYVLQKITPAQIKIYTDYINFLKALPNFPYINIHLYLYNANELPGIKRMIEYLKSYTGKDIIITECGAYSQEQEQDILNGFVQLAYDEHIAVMIFYNGNRISFDKQYPLEITKQQYFTAITFKQ